MLDQISCSLRPSRYVHEDDDGTEDAAAWLEARIADARSAVNRRLVAIEEERAAVERDREWRRQLNEVVPVPKKMLAKKRRR